jgi:PAS domain S-box-containing protein
VTGHPADELIGREFREAVHYTRSDGSPCPLADCSVTRALQRGTVHDGDGVVLLQRSTTTVPVDISCTPIIDAGRVTGAVVVMRDVTDRREAERAREELTSTLARQQAQLNEAQAVAECGSWEWDIAADAIDWSDELCRIYGLAPGAHPRSFDLFLDLIHPGDRSRVRSTVEAAYASGNPFSFKCRLVRPDASERIIFGAGEVRSSADGQPLRMLGTAQDVTERELLDAELRRSSRYFELSRDLVCAVDLNGRFAQVNAAWTRTLGWTEDELLGHHFSEFVHPDDLPPPQVDGDPGPGGGFASQPVTRYRTTDHG